VKGFVLGVTACVFITLQATTAHADPFSEVVAFGDSLSDVGNVYLSTGGALPASAPYDAGRFSNGPLWVENLASKLGLPSLTPSVVAGGTDYAFAGAQIHTATGFSFMGTPNLDTQIEMYRSAHSSFNSSQLITIWGGANDFLNGGVTDPNALVSSLAQEITTIANNGGKFFVVPNLPLLGDLPAVAAQGASAVAGLNALSAAFNVLLAAQESSLASTLGITIYKVDVESLFNHALQDPAAFSLTNVTGQAVDNGLNTGTAGAVVSNPNEYLFWDAVHPTATVHAIVGDAAFDAVSVPEPSSWVLCGIGLAVGLVVLRRKTSV
jgi:phospholipase/lecithinase/hemolysin